MEPATAFENFRILNDGIKAMLLAMPPVTLFAFTALYLDHRRRLRPDAGMSEEAKEEARGETSLSRDGNPDNAPINLSSATDRHAEMRDFLDEIRVRSTTWNKRD